MRSDGECPWRSAEGKDFPTPKDFEIVLFSSFLEHGLSMPVSNFMEGLLYYFKIQLHHLTPYSILHTSIFVHFCEAFLGIDPHFQFFRSLYKMTPLPFAQGMSRVECAHLELQEKVLEKYLEFPRITLDSHWPYDWFYIRNPSSGLPPFSAEPAHWLYGW